MSTRVPTLHSTRTSRPTVRPVTASPLRYDSDDVAAATASLTLPSNDDKMAVSTPGRTSHRQRTSKLKRMTSAVGRGTSAVDIVVVVTENQTNIVVVVAENQTNSDNTSAVGRGPSAVDIAVVMTENQTNSDVVMTENQTNSDNIQAAAEKQLNRLESHQTLR